MTQRIVESIEVQAPKQQVFEYWSHFENFPNFMDNIEEVTKPDSMTSHWKMNGPLGRTVEWEAKTTEMDPERGIAWNSIEGSELDNSGEAKFEELDNNRTRIEVTINYSNPPGGKLGEWVASLTGDPEKSLRQDLENFKEIIEEAPGRGE